MASIKPTSICRMISLSVPDPAGRFLFVRDVSFRGIVDRGVVVCTDKWRTVARAARPIGRTDQTVKSTDGGRWEQPRLALLPSWPAAVTSGRLLTLVGQGCQRSGGSCS